MDPTDLTAAADTTGLGDEPLSRALPKFLWLEDILLQKSYQSSRKCRYSVYAEDMLGYFSRDHPKHKQANKQMKAGSAGIGQSGFLVAGTESSVSDGQGRDSQDPDEHGRS